MLSISNKELQINEEIRDKELRVVDENGEQLGIMLLDIAQQAAIDAGQDLVKIVPQAKPPVAKIMDYGKFKFEQAKKEQEARKNQKTVDVKEVRLSPNIGDHDFQTRLNHAIRFLQSGDRVKVSIRFRGRQMAHRDIGRDTMNRFAKAVEEFGDLEKQPIMEGRTMIMYIASK